MNRFDTLRRAVFLAPLLCALAAALLPVAAPAATQGEGKPATESRNLAEFQSVAMTGSIDLVVRQGATQSVQVQADDRLLPRLETVVEAGAGGSVLKVRWKPGQRVPTHLRALVTVVMPKLTALSTAGSGDIRLDRFDTPALQVALAGSGNVRLDSLSTAELSVRINGSGDVAGNGSAARLKVDIAGSGDADLADLRSDEVSVSIAGSGDAAVHAGKTLAVSIAGSGDVTYSGNPEVRTSVAGSGSVTRK